MKHTPGPWEAKRLPHGWIVESKDEIMLTQDEESRYGPIHNESDARLIASAPELLEALEVMCNVGAD